MGRIRDNVQVALTASLVVVLGILVLPLMSILPLPIMKTIWIGPLFALSLYLLLGRTHTLGVSLGFGVVLGLLLNLFMPFALLVNGIAGIVSELLGLFFKGTLVRGLQAVAFPVLQVPLVFLFFTSTPRSYLVLLLLLTLLVAVTSALGVFLASSFEDRMKRAK